METVKKSITTVVGGVAEMPLGDVAVLKQLALLRTRSLAQSDSRRKQMRDAIIAKRAQQMRRREAPAELLMHPIENAMSAQLAKGSRPYFWTGPFVRLAPFSFIVRDLSC